MAILSVDRSISNGSPDEYYSSSGIILRTDEYYSSSGIMCAFFLFLFCVSVFVLRLFQSQFHFLFLFSHFSVAIHLLFLFSHFSCTFLFCVSVFVFRIFQSQFHFLFLFSHFSVAIHLLFLFSRFSCTFVLRVCFCFSHFSVAFHLLFLFSHLSCTMFYNLSEKHYKFSVFLKSILISVFLFQTDVKIPGSCPTAVYKKQLSFRKASIFQPANHEVPCLRGLLFANDLLEVLLQVFARLQFSNRQIARFFLQEALHFPTTCKVFLQVFAALRLEIASARFSWRYFVFRYPSSGSWTPYFL